MLRYFNFDPSFKLRWCLARDLFGTQIPVTTGESAKLRGLRSNVGCVGASVRGFVGASFTWSKFLCGLCGLLGSKYFCLGQHFFTWVIIFTWVTWVKCIFAWVKTFLRGSILFTWVKIFCVS